MDSSFFAASSQQQQRPPQIARRMPSTSAASAMRSARRSPSLFSSSMSDQSAWNQLEEDAAGDKNDRTGEFGGYGEYEPLRTTSPLLDNTPFIPHPQPLHHHNLNHFNRSHPSSSSSRPQSVRSEQSAHSRVVSAPLARLNMLLSSAGFPTLVVHAVWDGNQNIDFCDAESTIAVVCALVAAFDALSDASNADKQSHAMAESNMRVLEERVTRLKRDLAKAESAALALKDARRMAEEETRATKAQLKSTEKELRTARSDYLKLVDRLGVVCCDAGLRDLREGKSSYFPCAKCSTKLSASKAVSAEWVDGVGFADLVEDGPAAPAVFIAPRRRAVSISNSVPRSTNTARSSTPNRPSTPTRRALAGSPSPSPLRPVTPVSRTVSSVSRPASPTVKPKSTKPAAVAVQTKASVKDYSAAKDLKDKDTNPDFGSHAGSPSVQTPLSTISPSMSRSASPEPSIAASILSSTASTANMDSLAALLAQQTAVLTQHTTLLARLLGSSAEDPTISQPFSPVSPVTVDGEAIPPSTDASLHENDVGAPFTCESSRRASIASSNDVFADLDSIDEDFATSNDNHDSLVPSDFQVEPVSSSDRPEPSVLSRTEAASPDPVARASAAPVANSPDSAKTLVVYNPRSAAATSASTKSGKRLSQKVLHPTIRDLFVKVSGKARTFLDKRGGAMSVPPYSAAYPIVASVRGVAERRRG